MTLSLLLIAKISIFLRLHLIIQIAKSVFFCQTVWDCVHMKDCYILPIILIFIVRHSKKIYIDNLIICHRWEKSTGKTGRWPVLLNKINIGGKAWKLY
jgi:hypothetical protein